jgi:hypothetical protein
VLAGRTQGDRSCYQSSRMCERVEPGKKSVSTGEAACEVQKKGSGPVSVIFCHCKIEDVCINIALDYEEIEELAR